MVYILFPNQFKTKTSYKYDIHTINKTNDILSDGQTLPLNRRQKVFPNGTLIVEQTQRGEDAGTYTCQAANRQRHASRRDVEVQILGKIHYERKFHFTNFVLVDSGPMHDKV